MRAAAGIALVLGVILGAGCGAADTANIDCGAYVEYRENEYEAITEARPFARGARLGTGRNPCREDETEYELAEVRGVSPELLLADVRDRFVWVRRGVLTVLRDFPLSRRFRANPPIAARCRTPADVTVTLANEVYYGHFASARTERSRPRYSLSFTRDSRVRASRTVAGQPLLRPGDQVRVTGRSCQKPILWEIEVTTLQPAG